MPDPVAVNSMFARIARRYDVANRLLSGGVDVWWRRRLVSSVKRAAPQLILDVATGSGDVAFTLSRALPPTSQITGVDFCEPMLKEAEIKKKHHAQFANVSFQQADALALPFPADSFDAVTMSFGLRNMADRRVALAEIHRVLRPGGSVFLLEFSQPQRWFKPFYFFYLRRILPFVAGNLTGDRAAYVYLNNTIEQFPGRKALAAEIQSVGFSQVLAKGMTFGIVALHEAKKVDPIDVVVLALQLPPARDRAIRTRSANALAAQLNDFPQPQVLWALGFLISKPLPWRPSSKSIAEPSK